MAGNTLGDLLKAGQLDLLKQVSSENKSSEKKSAKVIVAKAKEASISNTDSGKDDVREAYKIFHSYVRSVVQKSELYDTMFDYGDEESFSAIAELYDNPVCRDIVDYFACCFFNGEYEFLDSIANDCEHGNDNTPDDLAVVLGHQVPITYKEEYDLLSLLCSTAFSLDGRFDDDSQEEEVIIYDQPLPTDEDVEILPYAVQSQVQSASRPTKPENTKALRRAQEVVNIPKKGSQIQRVKVVKQPVTPERTVVNNQPTEPVKKSPYTAKTRPAPKSKTPKVSVKKSVHPVVPTPSVVKVAPAASIEKPKQVAPVKRKLSLEEQHEQKTLELRNHLEYAYKQLGIADIVSDLYRKEKYGSIFTLFKVLQKEYYAKQHSLDAPTFRILWENAHHYVDVFIRGKRRVSSDSVIGYRKRSFKSHAASSGVWSRMALYGGTNGRIIRINAGHGRR